MASTEKSCQEYKEQGKCVDNFSGNGVLDTVEAVVKKRRNQREHRPSTGKVLGCRTRCVPSFSVRKARTHGPAQADARSFLTEQEGTTRMNRRPVGGHFEGSC